MTNPFDSDYKDKLQPGEIKFALQETALVTCYDKDRRESTCFLPPGEELVCRQSGDKLVCNRILRCGNPLKRNLVFETREETCELNLLNSFTLALGSGLAGYGFGDEKDWAGIIGGGLLATYAYQFSKDPKERKCRLIKNIVVGLVSAATGYLIGQHQKNIRDQHQEAQRLNSTKNPPSGPGPLPPPAPRFALELNAQPQVVSSSHLEIQTGIGIDSRIGIRFQYRF
ncbi:MAG TPA: hypothetical protein VJH70_02230 [Candidatus Paceibacterota bacterium]